MIPGSRAIIENSPRVWQSYFPCPQVDTHKYTRGTALIRGGELLTGAARLAARAAQRMGAGLVTIAAPSCALSIYAQSLESVIVRPCDELHEWKELIEDDRQPALLVGPGLGIGSSHKEEVLSALGARRPAVIDADGLTNFECHQKIFFKALHPECVLTPHEGEFSRLFGEAEGDKVSRVVTAADRAGCVVLLKGADTVIASPGGRVIVNRNAAPWLATAGSGDVLAGMILGLIAQKMPLLEAAAAAAWLHGDIAAAYGPGLIAEDIVSRIPGALQSVLKAKLTAH
jgi:hydroxyethylthiazole kinase-like uncharacterized protein yjeF